MEALMDLNEMSKSENKCGRSSLLSTVMESSILYAQQCDEHDKVNCVEKVNGFIQNHITRSEHYSVNSPSHRHIKHSKYCILTHQLMSPGLTWQELIAFDINEFWEKAPLDIMGLIKQIAALKADLLDQTPIPYLEYDPSKRNPVYDRLDRLMGKLNSTYMYYVEYKTNTDLYPSIIEAPGWLFDDTPSGVHPEEYFDPRFNSIEQRLIYRISKAVSKDSQLGNMIECFDELRRWLYTNANLLIFLWEELMFGLITIQREDIRRRMIIIRHRMEAIRSSVRLRLFREKGMLSMQAELEQLRKLFGEEAAELQSIDEHPDAIRYRTIIKHVNWILNLSETFMTKELVDFANDTLTEGPVEIIGWYKKLINTNIIPDIVDTVKKYFENSERIMEINSCPEGHKHNPILMHTIIHSCMLLFNEIQLAVEGKPNDIYRVVFIISVNLRNNPEKVYNIIKELHNQAIPTTPARHIAPIYSTYHSNPRSQRWSKCFIY